MPYLTIVEAASKVGWSVELLKYLTKNCPKHGEKRVLPCNDSDGQVLIDEIELLHYQRYLNERWPIPSGKTRPPMRKAIAEDVKAECHHGCAICGNANHGEVAHIHAAADGACNGPDNLLYLCPNHHTEYDYGHKVAANVRHEVINAAKTMKRDSRRRMLLFEVNVTKTMSRLIQRVKKLEEGLKAGGEADLEEVDETELRALMTFVGKASQAALKDAKGDKDHTPLEAALTKIAPKIAALAEQGIHATSEYEMRQAASKVVAASNKIIIDLDEVECPHCVGAGRMGRAGSLCSYCGGSCYVPTEVAENYNEDEIDEVACPRCSGSGQTGWVGDLCAYCKGDGFVTGMENEDYDPDEIDEVECPHCSGQGQLGWGGTTCNVCKGSCCITREAYEEYNPDDLDEEPCPRCSGKGQTGWTGNTCCYCHGDTYVTQQQVADYDPDLLDEVECPRCAGKGQIGWSGNSCPYCGGDCYVSREAAKDYNEDSLDEEDCPRCQGTGQTGLVGDMCKLCGGDCVVSHASADAYREQYG